MIKWNIWTNNKSQPVLFQELLINTNTLYEITKYFCSFTVNFRFFNHFKNRSTSLLLIATVMFVIKWRVLSLHLKGGNHFGKNLPTTSLHMPDEKKHTHNSRQALMLVYVEIVRKAKQAEQSFSASDCTWAFQLDLQSTSKHPRTLLRKIMKHFVCFC